MRCPRCEAENPEAARFCEECGARLVLACPHCGAEVSPGKKFCRSCGAPLTAVAMDRAPSPVAYTPKHLAERILTSKSALEGERKQVTVLFADLKGSMELLADRDPEEARKLLDPVLERMMEAVHRYEGTVNQVMGDGIMALFGAPLAHEDHAVRACYAALDLQAALSRYGEEVRRAHGVDLQVRVGLNSGEVVVRAIGSDLRMDYSAVGQTTHLAARMEQLARPGVTLLTPDTLRLAEGYVEVRPLGPVPVKGALEPIEVYELVGAGPTRSRLQAAAARGLTRFVGREREIEQLRAALGHATTGRGQIVAIVGEPGVGKSRLVWEVTHSHRTQGWFIVQAASVSYGKATPYLPVIDLLKAYFQIGERDDPRRMREKVMGKLLALDRSLEPSLPAFLTLLDVPVDDGAWEALDHPQRRQRTLEAIKRLLLRESQVQPLLLVFEDLHWIDSETQALLDSLIESLPTARVLLLVNYRPEYQHGWGRRTYYIQLRLDPLPPEGAEALLHSLLGDDASLRPLPPLLIERTEGNPFFLEESVRTLVETKVLIGERGAYRLVTPVPSIQVPTTVQAILAARIDRLPPREKRLLQSASVVGQDVPFVLLQALADESEGDLREALGALQAAEFLYEARLFPDLEYTFKHALTHDVAYEGLLQERRRMLHARIVDAIEQRFSGRLAEQFERLADHAIRGELPAKAVHYLRQAGVKALALSAYANAATYLEKGIAILDRLPQTESTLEHAVDLRLDLRTALVLLTDPDRGLAVCDEAVRLAEKLTDPERLGRAWAIKSGQLHTAFRRREAAAAAERACDVASTIGNTPLFLFASCYLGVSAVELGDFRRAEDALQRAVAGTSIARTDQLQLYAQARAAVISRGFLAILFAMRGQFSEARQGIEEELRLAEMTGQPNLLVLACIHVGRVLSLQGEFGQSAEAWGRGLHLAREWNLTMQMPGLAALSGFAHTRAGRRDRGTSLLDEAMGALNLRQPAFLQVALEIAEALVLLQRFEEALACARQALDAGREHGERPYEANALRLLAEVAVAGELDGFESVASTHYRQALATASELGMRPLVAHCYLGLGKLYRRTGDRNQAREHLATARTMYRDMDMRFWREQAEAAIAEVG
jgi:class 3 adenylate cyclase/tetratricopeptide (TPR) repeat protein